MSSCLFLSRILTVDFYFSNYYFYLYFSCKNKGIFIRDVELNIDRKNLYIFIEFNNISEFHKNKA